MSSPAAFKPTEVSALRLPPVTTMSPELPFQSKPLMSSLTVKVMVAVWPVLRLDWLELMAILGGVASTTGLTMIKKVSVTVRPPASVRVTVTLVVPVVVGVPLKVPVVASKLTPAGSAEVV